ncbi:MAG: VWA domain-containing protein [Acidobacteriota bacterium]
MILRRRFGQGGTPDRAVAFPSRIPWIQGGLLGVLPVLFLIGSLLQAQSDIRVDAAYIKVPVTVLDQNGRGVVGLRASDFRVFDEGEERPIANFILDQEQVNVVFLLDTSGSVKEELDQIRYATLRFAQHFSHDDRISVVSFSDEITTLQDWTNNLGHLRKSLHKLKAGYKTALYDALITTARQKLSRVSGRRVIILLTDGLDNWSDSTYDEAMNEMTRLNVVLYIVSRSRLVRTKVEQSERVEFLDRVMKNVLDDDVSFVDIYFKEKEVALNHLAEVNAGRVFYPDKLAALGQTYVRIAEELKMQYLLTFSPAAADATGPAFRRIRVQCLRDVGQVFNRKLYRAHPESSPTESRD